MVNQVADNAGPHQDAVANLQSDASIDWMVNSMESLDRKATPRPRRGICRDGLHGASHGGEDDDVKNLKKKQKKKFDQNIDQKKQMEVLLQLEMVLAFCQTTYFLFPQDSLVEMDT